VEKDHLIVRMFPGNTRSSLGYIESESVRVVSSESLIQKKLVQIIFKN
jgi:hypothetical protein